MGMINIFHASLFLLELLFSIAGASNIVTCSRDGASLQILPQELLDMILSQLSVEDYFAFREVFPGIRLSESRELSLISRGVMKVEEFHFDNYGEYQLARKRQQMVQSLIFNHVYSDPANYQGLKPRAKARYVTRKLRLVERLRLGGICELLWCAFMIDPDFISIWKRLSLRLLRGTDGTLLQACVLASNTHALGFFLAQYNITAQALRQFLLRVACSRGSVRVVTMLIEWPWRSDNNLVLVALWHAIDYDQVDLLDFILSNSLGVDQHRVEVDLADLICHALRRGRMRTLMLLLERAANKRTWRCSDGEGVVDNLNHSLAVAGRSGNLEAITTILWDEKKDAPRKTSVGVASVHVDIESIIQGAMQSGHIDVVHFFCSRAIKLHRHVDWSRLACTGFVLAAASGHLHILQYLSDRHHRGPSLSPFTSLGESVGGAALLVAADGGHLDVVQFLLGDLLWDQQLFPSAVSVQKAFLRSCQRGHVKLVRFFLRFDETGQPLFPSANNERINKRALRLAIRRAHLDIVEFLLSRRDGHYVFAGVDPSRSSSIAILLAVKSKSFALLSYLLLLDADGQYIFPGIDLAPRSQHILKNALKIHDPRFLRLLLQRNSRGEFVHIRLCNGESSSGLVYTAILERNHEALAFLISQDQYGHFIFPELRLREQLADIVAYASSFSSRRIKRIIVHAFPEARGTLL